MKLLLLSIFSLPVLLFAQANSNDGFVITGNIEGIPDNSVVSVTDVNNPTDTLAKSQVTKGSFTLKGVIAEPNLVQVNLDGAQKKSILFIGNEKLNITGNVANLQDLSVKGSPIHSDFMSFQKTFNPLFRRLSELNQQVSANPGLSREDTLFKQYTAQFKMIQDEVENFIGLKTKSPVSAFVLVVTSELEQDFSVLEKRFKKIAPEFQQGFYGKIISQQIEEAKIGAIGSEAMTFTQNDTTGKPVALESFRGKYVLIDFWASWCKPCRLENPNVVAAFEKFKNKNFTVLGVSLDRAREPWVEAIRQDKLAWTQVSDLKFWQNEVAMKYRVQGIPQNFLVGPDGKIVGKNLRGPQLESKLCELLGCN